jgi:hypothetical protein
MLSHQPRYNPITQLPHLTPSPFRLNRSITTSWSSCNASLRGWLALYSSYVKSIIKRPSWAVECRTVLNLYLALIALLEKSVETLFPNFTRWRLKCMNRTHPHRPLALLVLARPFFHVYQRSETLVYYFLRLTDGFIPFSFFDFSFFEFFVSIFVLSPL